MWAIGGLTNMGITTLPSVSRRGIGPVRDLYLNDGEYDGKQVISQEWVNDSLQIYSEDAWTTRIGRNIKDIGYGYQWWSARSGDHHYDYAWGHGGQLIVLLDEFEMIIVLTADPFYGNHFEFLAVRKSQYQSGGRLYSHPYRVNKEGELNEEKQKNWTILVEHTVSHDGTVTEILDAVFTGDISQVVLFDQDA